MSEESTAVAIETEIEPVRTRFQLLHIPTQENTAVVELEEKLLGDPKFIDPDTMTFPNIPHGNQFTLIPLDDPTVAVLTRVAACHRMITTKPCPLPTQMMHRMDELVQIVGLMFGEVEAFLIESVEDIALLTKTEVDENYEPPKVVKRTILGSLLDDVKAKLAEQESDGDDSGEVS